MMPPDGWLIKPLGEVAQILMGQSPDSNYYFEEEVGLPFLQGCAEFQARHPKHAIYCSQSKKIGCAGSILLSVRAPVGRLNVANRDYVIGRGLAALNGTRVTQDFLEHFLVLQEPRFRLASQGSTFEAINSSELKQWPILHPKDKAEQAKIAEVLSTVDLAIEDTEALIAKQQRIKTGLMQDLLTRGIDEHGNLRSEHTHEFKDSPLGRIPVEWEVMTLGAMLKRARGNLQTGPFGSQLHAHEYVHEGTPVIMPQDILNGQISTSLIARIPEWRANELRRHRLLPNDIVFSRRGDLSRASGIGEREAGWICGTGCFLLRVSADTIDSTWLANVYRHHNVQRQVDTNAVGSTMPSLNNAVMENLTIAFPKANEQKEIVRRCEAAEDGIASTFDQLAKMRALKRGLMQDLLTGNRRVTPLLEQREAVTT